MDGLQQDSVEKVEDDPRMIDFEYLNEEQLSLEICADGKKKVV